MQVAVDPRARPRGRYHRSLFSSTIIAPSATHKAIRAQKTALNALQVRKGVLMDVERAQIGRANDDPCVSS